MPNDRDDTRLTSPSQLLFDVLTYIEQLRRTLADTEAMAHGAESKLARLPYIPWPGQPQEADFGASTTVRPRHVPRHVMSAPAIDAGAPEYEPEYLIEQRLDVGRLHTYVIASATSMRDVMAECDRLIAYTRRRIEEVRGMRMVPADDPSDPSPQGPAGTPSANTPDPTDDEDTEPSSSQDSKAAAASSQNDALTIRGASRDLDPAKVARAARAAARRPTTAKPNRTVTANDDTGSAPRLPAPSAAVACDEHTSAPWPG
ncbi:hypothetical protein [Haliangium sp.]|uniref:hypothetical protein n=1 Tax=Haliangium sp. TaxID=2663208 RepID=UPI003D0B448F